MGANVNDSDTEQLDPSIECIIHKYADVFVAPTQLPPERPKHDHKIPLMHSMDHVNKRPYRYAKEPNDIIDKLIQEMLKSWVIQNSTSPYVSPVVLVGKKDGTWRLCVDYRDLNKGTVKDRFPIPLVDDLMDELHGSSIFSKIDLRAGYHQVRMSSPDIHKTAFRTHSGYFEYLVMPFGLTNAPTTFQSLMNSVFKDFLHKFLLVFFDDILIYNSTLGEHLRHLELVLAMMRKHPLFAKHSKCYFVVSRVEYLSHFISAQGVATDPTKISAVHNWPLPQTLKQLREFLGLAGYYRRFVKGYGTVAKPLIEMLKKDKSKWSPEAKNAFEHLKELQTSAPILALPNFAQEFTLEVDASGQGVGVVLMQNNHPIAFISRMLNQQQQALSTYEKELIAVVFVVQKWRHYLLNKHFIIRTDHRSPKYILDQRLTTDFQQKWLVKLMEFDFSIEYKLGRENVVVDALSRMEGHECQTCWCIPWIQNGGHSGRNATTQRIKAVLHWKGMNRDVKTFIQQFSICQRCKYDTVAYLGLLQPFPIPDQVWQHITMDFIEGLPNSHGKQVIYVVVDRLSKATHFIQLVHPYTASIVAQAFMDHVFKLHGFPSSIMSDRYPIFISRFWQELMAFQGVKLQLSTSYHPQTDGQSEVVNRCSETYLRCMCANAPQQWSKWLPLVEWWYNTTFHTSIQATPYEVVYGQPPPTSLPYLPGKSKVQLVDRSLAKRKEMLKVLKFHLRRAQDRMKQLADKSRSDRQFNEGDLVYVKLHSYKQISVAARVNEKLATKYFGPFPIISKVGAVAYKVQFPDHAKTHNVFMFLNSKNMWDKLLFPQIFLRIQKRFWWPRNLSLFWTESRLKGRDKQ
ncbi:PREDICTED: uncharacterized protein LOC109326422 [Lupinus angustifolius]|uniref:uncharacterized protein LOC109326422 n=1 Tax=Lupinus angustifolius TaxID=3871 RepID=UPI00092F7278|nr:PREDICTED: uncharacterized protein LOC109326422 [Lupinus angustifolius]